MQRTETHSTPIQEEWTKYFVNDKECKKEDIYRTILDNQFYNKEIQIKKKYHFKLETVTTIITKDECKDEARHYYSCKSSTNTLENSNSKNRSANFSLVTTEFVEKFSPTSEEFKLLIEKMIHVVDMFHEAQHVYDEYSKKLRDAMSDCMTFFLGKKYDFNAPYNNIMCQFISEYMVFITDLLAFALDRFDKNDLSEEPEESKESNECEKPKKAKKMKMPSCDFDLSSIEEKWNETWSNEKKSQYVENYLSLMLNQTERVARDWLKLPLFSNCLADIQNKFDSFKHLLISLQAKKAALDDYLDSQSVASNVASFFQRVEQSNPSLALAEVESTVSNLVCRSPKS